MNSETYEQKICFKELKVKAEAIAEVHLMPCKIQHNGPANVAMFFNPSRTRVEGSATQETATFRGRPLDGDRLKLPDNYSFSVLKESNAQNTSDENEREFTVMGQAKDVIYWNLDSKPSDRDKMNKLSRFLEVAEALHGDD